MARDLTAEAQTLLSAHTGFLSGPDTRSLGAHLSQVALTRPELVYNVLLQIEFRGYPGQVLLDTTRAIADALHPAQLLQMARTTRVGKILLVRMSQILKTPSLADLARNCKVWEALTGPPAPVELSQEVMDFYARLNGQAARVVTFRPEVRWELPRSGPGYETYNRNDLKRGTDAYGYDQVGTRGTVEAVLRLAREWLRAHPDRPLQVGDISRPGGIDTPDHLGHEAGKNVDLRPLRKDSLTGDGARLTYRDRDAYDPDLTREFIRLARRLHPGLSVRFNDPAISGDAEFKAFVRKDGGGGKVHDNHLHLDFP
ncbi:hypothetical protein [Tautonia plasticadhaerens]|uniref:Penicillin-insensitive murein endopeptidase n=1 Tax=Tautonia plasticadhaerens TaxID=2527974 RepID=A0A518H2D1_9BACT|nr:hypothetical protein [Tautonia plasticadhaerens]QDV35012.1 hypothetical protein ElP_29090 [Tautonia plasticadhaerens]